MVSEKEWNDKIMFIMNKIKNTHPELLPFIDEMPMTIPKEKNPSINVTVLKEYFDSLENLEKSVIKSKYS